MNTISHCPACGERTAVRTVVCELSSLYECRCGHAFERDHPTMHQEETRAERVERILGGKLRGKVRRASELEFDYERATATAMQVVE